MFLLCLSIKEDETDDENEDERTMSCSEPEDEEGLLSSSGAAQLAARLRATAQRFFRNMGRVAAVTLLALAGKTTPTEHAKHPTARGNKYYYYFKSMYLKVFSEDPKCYVTYEIWIACVEGFTIVYLCRDRHAVKSQHVGFVFCRYHLAVRLLCLLLPALHRRVHVVGLSLSHQSSGL